MSRTFRRKNYESEQWSKAAGFKYGGFYVVHEYLGEPSPFGKYQGWHWGWRAPTREEYNKRYWRIHGESSTSSSYGPNRYYKRMWSKQHRKNAEIELRRYAYSADHEVMILSPTKKEEWSW